MTKTDSNIFLKIIASILILAVSAVLFVVGALIVGSPVSIEIRGNEAAVVEAAVIGGSYTVETSKWRYDEFEEKDFPGIPGETAEFDIIIEIDGDDSDRAFVYEIKLGLPQSKQEIIEDVIKEIKFDDKKEAAAKYGVWKPGGGTVEVKIPVTVTFKDEEFMYGVNGDTDSSTMGVEFKKLIVFPHLSVKYVQGTEQAIKSVFVGIGDDEIENLIAEIDEGGS